MLKRKTYSLKGKTDKSILVDVCFSPSHIPKPIVIFCHGFKGYKDWGAWNLVAESFAEKDFFFIKFNFSHNGGTPEQPIDFPDLKAFSEDNLSIQLDDLETVIDWILTTKEFVNEANVSKVHLIGHSRGGGIVLIKANENKHISKVITWAGVSDYAARLPKGEPLEEWKNKGVRYITNSRTQQEMPVKYQFYEDFIAQADRFNLKKVIRHLQHSILIVHARDDQTLNFDEAKHLHKWARRSQLTPIDSGGHTFGSKQPWDKPDLPTELQEVVDKTITFLKK